MRGGITRRLRPSLPQSVVQQLPAFARDTGRALDRTAEAVELARDIIQGRLDLLPQLPAALREKQIACGAANDSAHDGCDDSSVLHVRLLRLPPGCGPHKGPAL